MEFSKGEWGRGQEEINLRYADALEMADRHVLYKHGVKEIAYQQGCSVTFMAKYDMGAAGSSFHLHSSVWDQAGRRNLFAAKDGGRQGTPLFQQWLAGQMAMAREFAYFYAPTVNAYKRYQAGSFAPTRIAWGWDNRTCGFRDLRRRRRLPGREPHPGRRRQSRTWPSRPPSRRGCTASAQKLAPPAMFEGNAYEDTRLAQVPKTLRDALAELRGLAGRARGVRTQGRGALPPARAARSSRRSTSPSPTGS